MDKIIIWLTPVVLIFYISFMVDVSKPNNTGYDECMKVFDDTKCFGEFYKEFRGWELH